MVEHLNALVNLVNRRSRVQSSPRALRIGGEKMEVVLKIKSENLSKVKDLLLKDEIVNRASMTFKEGKDFDIEGYVCYISGTDERCQRALEIVKIEGEEGNVTELAEEVESSKAEEIIKKIKEEEDKAIEGFGSFLG